MAVQAALIGLVFFFLGRKIYTDWPQIRSYPWDFDVPWLIASIIFLIVMYMGHAFTWLLILLRFKHPVPVLPGLYVWFKSLIARYVPGNVLMVLGRVIMIEPYGVPKRISLTSVAYEQAMLLATATTVIAVALPFWPKLQSFSSFIWLVLIVPPIAIIMLHPKILDLLGNWVLRKAGRETIEDFLPFTDIVWIFCLYAILWVVAGLGLFAMASAVTNMEFAHLPIVIASAPLAWLISVMFFISPSGLGVREGVYAYTLDFAFENAGVASAFAILIRFWQTLLEVVVVLVVMGLVKVRHIKMKTAAAGKNDVGGDGAAPPL
ncbi:MAG: lysylphosphatidylglycerol synthase domain-containing protein [Thermoleophilia bacterium]